MDQFIYTRIVTTGLRYFEFDSLIKCIQCMKSIVLSTRQRLYNKSERTDKKMLHSNCRYIIYRLRSDLRTVTHCWTCQIILSRFRSLRNTPLMGFHAWSAEICRRDKIGHALRLDNFFRVLCIKSLQSLPTWFISVYWIKIFQPS